MSTIEPPSAVLFSAPTPTPHHRLLRRHAGPALLYLALMLFALRMLANTWLRGHLESIESPLYYHAGTLAFNYIEMGAVRRGLGGTLVYLLAPHRPLLGTALFHCLWAATLAVPLTWLTLRIPGPTHRRLAFGLVALFMMHRWGEDAGRIDIAVATLLAGATVAVLKGRLGLAAAAIGAGLFLHETSFIYGLPLLAALVWRQGGWRTFEPASRRAAVLALAVALAGFLLLPHLPHVSPHDMVAIVQSKFPPKNASVAMAIYFAVGEGRGVQTSICANLVDPTYWVHPLGGLVVLLAAYLALAGAVRREWPAVLLAALPPLVFLTAVANDGARWTMLSALNIWLLLATKPMPRRQNDDWVFVSGACAVAFLVLSSPLLVRVKYPIYTGSPLVQKVVDRLTHTSTPSPATALRRCDPQWHEVVSPPSPQHSP